MGAVTFPHYVLAGGRSTRFGSDKARATVDGRPLLSHHVDALRPVASTTVVVAREADAYSDLGLATIADREPDLGPVGGIATALHHHAARPERERGDGWIFVSACDIHGARVEWVRGLAAHRTTSPAVAFRTRAWEPLFALYHLDAAPTIADAIARGRFKLQDLLTKIDTTPVPPPPDWPGAVNVNEPSDLPR